MKAVGGAYKEDNTVVWGTGGASARTQKYYDQNGNLSSVVTTGNNPRTRTYINDSNGMTLEKTEGATVTRMLIANGELIGSSDKKSESFTSGLEPVTSPALAAAPGVYFVRQNSETFPGIAKAIWGDASLWWMIADANGAISDTDGLKQGERLTLPTRVNTANDNYRTFKPYDAGKVIGDTTPVLAMPAPSSGGGGCGGLGSLLMVVIAVVATIYTAGAYAVATGAATATATSTTMGLGYLTTAHDSVLCSNDWNPGLG